MKYDKSKRNFCFTDCSQSARWIEGKKDGVKP
jgi:hypothetical protein